MNQFRYRYRHVDMLVIDDIHFLGGTRAHAGRVLPHVQHALPDTTSRSSSRADCPPSEIPELEERLVIRFNWGLVARIEKPCYETRMAILQKKAKLRGLELPEDVVCYIAAKVENNTRELEGAITKLQGMSLLQQRPRSTSTWPRPALGESAHARAEAHHHPADPRCGDEVLQRPTVATCRARSATRASPSRGRSACILPGSHTRYSLEEIGGYFGGRDHTTVLHAVRTVGDDCQSDREVAKQLNYLESQLAG